MTGLPVSVVIVSRDRRQALGRCLTGVGQLYYHPFEIIVVADAAGRAAVANHPLGARVKLVGFDDANISAARNAGIAAAGGEMVAFIDDDAVPEPGWLDHLVRPIAADEAEATGGFVRGRNGISFQWRARVAEATGQARRVPVPENGAPFVPEMPPGAAVKTEGTNMAVRRDVLQRLGGFDPRFRFYLDETDLNLRMAGAGLRTVLVPLAEVHHGFAPSARRREDRLPLDLFDIGASASVFWKKHTPEAARDRARDALLADQRARLVRHMVAGRCEPGAVARLMGTLLAGLSAGDQRLAEAVEERLPGPQPFRPLHGVPPSYAMAFLGGRASDASRLLEEARARLAAGGRASVVVLSRLPWRHRVAFTEPGIWVQQGGIWGRADRDRPERPTRDLAARLERERQRVAAVRFHLPA